MNITISIKPTPENDDRYDWTVLVGDALNNEVTHTGHGDLQDDAARQIGAAVHEIIVNAEIY